MKRFKIKYIAYGLLGLLSFSACTLDEENFTEIEKSKYVNNAKDAETVLLGVYRNMVEEGMYRCGIFPEHEPAWCGNKTS